MQETIVITGINGFVGEHVAREFKSRGFSVTGIGHDGAANERVSGLIDAYIGCDLLDENQVSSKLSFRGVHAVIHLAGLANVGQSFDEPQRFMTENGIMTHNILSKAMSDNMEGRIVAISTGALYDPKQPLPLSEVSETYPYSPYAVGKLMSEDVVHYYRTRGIDAIVARPFNHIGPGQNTGFILPDFYEQLVSAKESGTMLVGNIDTRRDYTDVRDIARAYAELALADSLEHSLYNICSGESLSGRDILSRLQNATNIKDVEISIDSTKIRPTDIDNIIGDSTRIHNELNWSPQISIDQTIKDFVASRA